MNTLLLLSTILGFIWSAFNSHVLRKQKKWIEEFKKKVFTDIKTLHSNQKVLHSDIKDLNARLTKYEKIQKGAKTTIIRPKG